MTWKLWAENDDLLFEGSEVEAREYVAEHPDSSQVVLESPDRDSYSYQDGNWCCSARQASGDRTGLRGTTDRASFACRGDNP